MRFELSYYLNFKGRFVPEKLVCLSVYLSICLSVYLSVCLSIIYLFIYLFIYLENTRVRRNCGLGISVARNGDKTATEAELTNPWKLL